MTDLRVSQLSVEVLVSQYLYNLGDLTSDGVATATAALSGGTPVDPTAVCKVGIAEDSGNIRVFFAQSDGTLSHITYPSGGPWGSPTSLGFSDARGSDYYWAGFAPVSYTVAYLYLDLIDVSGCTLYRTQYGTPWAWHTGPHIFTGKGASSLHAGTFIDAATLDGVDYIVISDHDDGRVILVKYEDGEWSDPVSVLPLDIISDPTDTTIPASQFKPYSLTVENGQLVLMGRLVRPGSGAYDNDLLVMMRGDGDHWTLDRHHAVMKHDNSNYVGSKLYLEGDYAYLVSPQKILRSTASYLLGVDLAAKKVTVTTDDIKAVTYSHPGPGGAIIASVTIKNADGAYDSDIGRGYAYEISQDALAVLELGWSGDGESDYVQISEFGIDSIQEGASVAEKSLSLSMRSKSMKKLLDWRAGQAYDYYSQCKIYDRFEKLGGYTEWVAGWDLDEDNERIAATALFGYYDENVLGKAPTLVVDTTDWTSMDGVLIKTKFRFVSSTATVYYGAGIILNATDKDYWEVVEAATHTGGVVSLYHVRDGTADPEYERDSSPSFSTDTWYDMAVLYRSGKFRVYYKLSSSPTWIELSGDFPYLWDMVFPGIEAEIYSVDPEETKAAGAVGDTYAADDGYVGLRAYCTVPATTLSQELYGRDKNIEDDYECIVVVSLDDFPSSGILQIGDEKVVYTAVNSAQLSTTLAENQNKSGEENFEVASVSGFPAHGIILVEDDSGSPTEVEAISYSETTIARQPRFVIDGRAVGDTEAQAFAAYDLVYLDDGVVRKCTHFFKAPYFTGAIAADGTVDYLEDTSEPWGAVDIANYRIEIRHSPTDTADQGIATAAYEGYIVSRSAGEQEGDHYVCEDLSNDPPGWIDPTEWSDWNHTDPDYFNFFELKITEDHLGGSTAPVGQTRNIKDNDTDTLRMERRDFEPVAETGDKFEIWGSLRSKCVYDERKRGVWFGGEYEGYNFSVIYGTGAGQTRQISTIHPVSGQKPPCVVLESSLDIQLDTTSGYIITQGDWGATEYREIDRVEGSRIYPKEPFDNPPQMGTTYVIRGRGAYGTTPTAHLEEEVVQWYLHNPVQFDGLEVYSLGRDYTVDRLFKDICWRCGVVDFTNVFLGSVSSTGMSVNADSYYDHSLTLQNATRKNFEATFDLSLAADDHAEFGLIYRSSTQVSTGSHSLPRAAINAYELRIDYNAGYPLVSLFDLSDGTEIERAICYVDISGEHTWRISVWEDFCSVWCNDALVWSFHDTTYQDPGYAAVRLCNSDGSGGAINFVYDLEIPEVTDIEPWFGISSGVSGQQAIQQLIRQRKVWYTEKADSSLQLSRHYTRTNLSDTYTYNDDNLHQTYRVLSDLNISTVVLVTSEEYAYYVNEAEVPNYGYRLMEVSNPDLNTEEECYDDARIVSRMSLEGSEQRGFNAERAHLEIEPEDYLVYSGTSYIVSDMSLSLGEAQLTQGLGCRLYYTLP